MEEIIIQAGDRDLQIAAGRAVCIVDILADNQVKDLKINIGPGARVTYVFIAARQTWSKLSREIMIGKAAALISCQAYLGVVCPQLEFINQIGEGSELSHQSLFILNKEQRLVVSDRHIFSQPGAQGKFWAEGLIDDAAKIEYLGEVNIKPEGRLVDARIDLRLNLLGQQARGLMEPALYIAANEVKAGHGAATFNLGAEELFYLNSRGLGESQAKRLALKSAAQRFSGVLGEEIRIKEFLQSLIYEFI